jgi:DNA adenine methylase
MTTEDHARLLGALGGLRARVMISGYPSALYDAALAARRRVETRGRPHMANSGRGRTGDLWMDW